MSKRVFSVGFGSGLDSKNFFIAWVGLLAWLHQPCYGVAWLASPKKLGARASGEAG